MGERRADRQAADREEHRIASPSVAEPLKRTARIVARLDVPADA
jgi:hypothetical protein